MTIAGSDSGGGAGLQADLKVFEGLGVHGTTVVTGITAQSPSGVRGISEISARMIKEQFEVVYEELEPSAIKTGALFGEEGIGAVSECLEKARESGTPVVVDPVMVATSGSILLTEMAQRAMRRDILPRALVVTPNLHEARVLTGFAVMDVNGMKVAAKKIFDEFGCQTLVKGGHLLGREKAIDIFWDGQNHYEISGDWVRTEWSHGTGCTLSAAITGYLCLGLTLLESIGEAKKFITRALAGAYKVGKHGALNSSSK